MIDFGNLFSKLFFIERKSLKKVTTKPFNHNNIIVIFELKGKRLKKRKCSILHLRLTLSFLYMVSWCGGGVRKKYAHQQRMNTQANACKSSDGKKVRHPTTTFLLICLIVIADNDEDDSDIIYLCFSCREIRW